MATGRVLLPSLARVDRSEASKPLLRGLAHLVATPFALIGTAELLLLTSSDRPKQVSFLRYGGSLTLLFAVSAFYHTHQWPARNRTLLQRFDGANIFLLIAATYTAVVFNTIRDPVRTATLGTVWALAVLGGVTRVRARRPASKLPSTLYVVIGLLMTVMIPEYLASLGPSATVLIRLASFSAPLGRGGTM